MAITLVEPPSPYFLPLLIFIVLFEVALLLGKRQKCKSLTLEIKSLTLRKFELALAMKSLGIPTDFVKKSKLERELIQVEKDLAPRREQVLARAKDYDALASRLQYGVYALLVIVFWRTRLVVMSPAATWPLSSFFGFPRLGLGAVGVSAVISMAKAVIKPFTPLLSSV
ncbi:hypothetical protein NSK_003813 [Nannochloropsis salina CCMP1776]|uniref:Tail-anchored protein insertion receptor WRB n=1 Tax=Nannochloropsis salina CCMP1776 TaxID=1027361 RepID=A0A4D9CZG3_9STRA|nr:hypothetical protein NSK_003813 [Nannochloropsis salina CCMP1776]|eukprot:TFJ84781.1 hypothetical protein NSK_003813 [Nannochloropsis salina CCMP1776]